jgi:DNA polymerase epsilon subunit 1
LKDSSLVNFDLRSILDWEYYIERLGSVIQKLITIPAAMQRVPNPVPRIRHPDWLHRRVAGAVDKFKQNKVTDFFRARGSTDEVKTQPVDIEDIGSVSTQIGRKRITVTERTFVRERTPEALEEILPDPSDNYSAWIRAMRPRWKRMHEARWAGNPSSVVPHMFKSARVRTNQRWDILQLRETKIPGRFILWLSIDSELVSVPLRIPREFYIHLKNPVDNLFQTEYYSCVKVTRTLPRDAPCTNLYKITVKEDVFQDIQEHFIDITNDPNVDGVYELQV